MGDHFKTDIGQLEQFLTNLERCVDELNEARSALDHVRADQIGTARLDEACDKFQDEWKYGSDKTKEMIDAIKEGVKSNKKGYEEVEGALEKALKQIADQSTSGGDGGGK
jgi:chromosome segregation ATPase